MTGVLILVAGGIADIALGEAENVVHIVDLDHLKEFNGGTGDARGEIDRLLDIVEIHGVDAVPILQPHIDRLLTFLN